MKKDLLEQKIPQGSTTEIRIYLKNHLGIDLTKIRKMVNILDKSERYDVVQNTVHDVEGQDYVIAKREYKEGYVRVPVSILKEDA